MTSTSGYQSILNQSLYDLNAGDVLINGLTADSLVAVNNSSQFVSAYVVSPLEHKNSVLSLNTSTLLSALTTDNLTEGKSNLYFTDARFDSRLATRTTDNLAEGSNLYYTDARFDSRLATRTTTNLDEGSNLYYTNARARAALSAGSGISYNNTTGVISTSGLVTSITGTANQVIASAATGAVTLSLPQNVDAGCNFRCSKIGVGRATTDAGITFGGQVETTALRLGDSFFLGPNSGVGNSIGIHIQPIVVCVPGMTGGYTALIAGINSKNNTGTPAFAYGIESFAPNLGATLGVGTKTDSMTIGTAAAWANRTTTEGKLRVSHAIGVGMNPGTLGVRINDLTASTLVATDANKQLVSTTNTLTPTFSRLALGADYAAGDSAILTTKGSLSADQPNGILLNSTVSFLNEGSAKFGRGLHLNALIAGSGFQDAVTQLYIKHRTNSTRTVTYAYDNSYGIEVDVPTAHAGGGLVPKRQYGIYSRTPTQGTTSNCAIYGDNLSVGYAGVSPPASGAIISGNVGIGKNTASTRLDVDGTVTATDMVLSGGSLALGTTNTTNTIMAVSTTKVPSSSVSYGLLVNPGIGSSLSSADIYSLFVNANVNVPSVNTANSYVLRVGAMAHNGAGVSANAYGLSVRKPATGTNRFATQTDDLYVGSTISGTNILANGIYTQAGVRFGSTSPTQTVLNNYAKYDSNVTWNMGSNSVAANVKLTRVGNTVTVCFANFSCNMSSPGQPTANIPSGFEPISTALNEEQTAVIFADSGGAGVIASVVRITQTQFIIMSSWSNNFPIGARPIFPTTRRVSFSYIIY